MYCKYFIILFITALSLSVFCGCSPQDDPRPTMGVPYTPLPQIQTPAAPRHTENQVTGSVPASWVPPKWLERKWTAIVIHHSATDNGNSEIFDRWHKEKNWDGVGYDFVIGNGSNSRDGQVEVTFRWTKQKTGAHCGGTPGNWANVSGIGICLVGDFNEKPPTYSQMQSLKKLVNFLQKRYNIPGSKVYGHGHVPGGHATDCPGKYFPMSQVK